MSSRGKHHVVKKRTGSKVFKKSWEDVTVTEIIDGFAGITHNWGALNICFPFRLPRLIQLETLKSTDARGLNITKGRNGVKLNLSSVNDHEVVLVTTWGRDTNNEKIMEDSLEKVGQAFVSTIDACIKSDMLNGSKTKNYWRRLCCPTYKEVVSSDFCIYCENEFNRNHHIYQDDFKLFGDEFNRRYILNLQGNFTAKQNENLAFDAFLLISSFGQSAKSCYVEQKLGLFGLDLMEAVAIHYANDFELSEHCLFWNKENLGIATNPKYVYYPGFTMSGNGNFTYDIKHDNVEDGQPYDVEVKAYTVLGRALHLNNTKPFKDPSIAELLHGGMPRERISDFKNLFYAVKRHFECITENQMIDARLEAIIVVNNPEKNCIGSCKKRFRDHYKAENFKKKLKIVPFGKFRVQCRKTFEPIANSLFVIILEFQKCYEENDNFSADFGTVQLAAYYEMLLCWFIYGTLYNENGRFFSTELVQNLKMKPPTFEKPTAEIFNGLEFVKDYFKVENNRAVPTKLLKLTDYAISTPDLGNWITLEQKTTFRDACNKPIDYINKDRTDAMEVDDDENGEDEMTLSC